MKRLIIIAAALLTTAAFSWGQSKDFKLGQWVEINNAILRELGKSYVDSLPVSRIGRAGIDAMLENLDPYTMYIPEEENEDLMMMINKSYGGIGSIIYKPEVDGYVLINEPYANSPAHKAGLQCGDEIMAIDGQTTIGLTAAQSSDKMKGKPGTEVVFTVKKAYTGEVKDISIVREKIHLPDIEYAAMLDDTTGYILQSGFTDNVSSEVRSSVLKLKSQGMKRLFLDLRGNGGGLLSEAINIVSLFVPKGSLVVSQKDHSGKESKSFTQTEPIDTLLPIVVLVDGGSASASEIVSGAIQDLDRGTVMGRRTYGKGLVQSIRPLPYNGQLKITVAKYYTPSGRCVQAIDYARRGDDGSVSHIPDSLTKEFKTLKLGRPVRDGGGITPDIELKYHRYSRLVYSLVLNGIIEQYALSYVKAHETIAPAGEFRFTDYADFIAYAATRDFDYRSSAKTLFDQMKSELEKDGVAASMTEQLEAMDKAINMEKEAFLRLKQDEIVPFIEEEIVTRYYFQQAGIAVRLRYDSQLKEALEKPLLH